MSDILTFKLKGATVYMHRWQYECSNGPVMPRPNWGLGDDHVGFLMEDGKIWKHSEEIGQIHDLQPIT